MLKNMLAQSRKAYLIAHNSKETSDIFRISRRKSARGIRNKNFLAKSLLRLLHIKFVCLCWLLVKPGTPEHRNTEHRNSIIPEHGTPEH